MLPYNMYYQHLPHMVMTIEVVSLWHCTPSLFIQPYWPGGFTLHKMFAWHTFSWGVIWVCAVQATMFHVCKMFCTMFTQCTFSQGVVHVCAVQASMFHVCKNVCTMFKQHPFSQRVVHLCAVWVSVFCVCKNVHTMFEQCTFTELYMFVLLWRSLIVTRIYEKKDLQKKKKENTHQKRAPGTLYSAVLCIWQSLWGCICCIHTMHDCVICLSVLCMLPQPDGWPKCLNGLHLMGCRVRSVPVSHNDVTQLKLDLDIHWWSFCVGYLGGAKSVCDFPWTFFWLWKTVLTPTGRHDEWLQERHWGNWKYTLCAAQESNQWSRPLLFAA